MIGRIWKADKNKSHNTKQLDSPTTTQNCSFPPNIRQNVEHTRGHKIGHTLDRKFSFIRMVHIDK